MLRASLFYFLCMSMIVPIANSANLYLKIEGLTGELKKNVNNKLLDITKNKIIIDNSFYVKINKAIRLGLRPLGYYKPTIKFSYQEYEQPFRPVLIVKVNPGEPVYVKDVKVILKGAARYDKDYTKMIAHNIPQKEIILNHSHYEDFKKEFTRLAVHKGYFDAKMEKSQLGISLDYKDSYWLFNFNSGERYRFGVVKYKGVQISEDYLNNIIPFKYGDYYDSEQLAKFTQQLISTGWFNSVIVTPDINKAHEIGTHFLPINAEFIPCAQNHIELGTGYATNIGFKVKIIWNKPWINFRGQSFSSSVSLSQSEQNINLNCKIPLQKSPLEHYYVVQAGFKRTNFNSIQSDTTILNLLRNWDYYKGWRYGINLHWSLSSFTKSKMTDMVALLYPGVNFTRIRQRGDAMLYWGDSQHYTFNISNTSWGSDINFIILQAQNIWIRTLWKRHRFILRGDFGWIKSNQFNKIPLDLRFFAGGDRSIRGFNYEKNTLTNNKKLVGTSVGASKLAIGSLEYQYNMINNWWGAMFVDCGEAVNYFNKNDFKIGLGVGVRWVSPVGPIKLDIATPVSNANHGKIQFYIGLGAEL